jgi:hypothetical protein
MQMKVKIVFGQDQNQCLDTLGSNGRYSQVPDMTVQEIPVFFGYKNINGTCQGHSERSVIYSEAALYTAVLKSEIQISKLL